MGSDFITKIGEIAEVFDGPHATPKKIDTGPYFLSISSLENGQLDLSKSAHLSEEQFVKWTKRVTPREGDVLFSYETRLGEAALMPGGVKACLGRRMGLLRPNLNKVLPEYLLYAYLSPAFQSEIKKRTNHGATVERISLKELPDFEVRIPALSEQKSTVKILKALNEKIALNNQISQTLEQMAQTLFKSWFVDFDPVIDNALDAGNPIPDLFETRVERRKTVRESADFKPLPDDVRQLFPSEFEESELGWVPKGWSRGVLSDIARYGKERIDVESLSLDNYISTENMLAGRKGVEIAAKLPTVKTVPAYSKGYVLVSNIRPYFKKIWLANELGGYSNDVLGFAPTYEGTEEYIFNLLYQDQFFDYMMTTSKGSKMPRGDKKAIADWEVVMPPHLLMQFYSQQVASYYEQSKVRNLESKTLEKLRDTLLPKLISGELRLDSPAVEQAKTLVE